MVCIAFALKSLFLTQNSVLPTSTKVSQKRHGRWCENIVSCVRSQLAASEVAPVFSDWCVSAIAAHAGQSAPNAHSHYMSRHPKSPYFEGWYLRLTLPESNTSYSFIFAVEAPSVGTVQVFDAQDTLYVHQLPRDTRLTLSTSSWTLSQWGYAFPTSLIKRCNGVRIDSPLSYSCRHVLQGWHLDAYGTQGTFVSNDVPVQWAFNYQPTLSWGPRGSGKHTGTWLANYPIFEPGYQVLMAHGCVSSGYIKIGDDFIDTKGSIVYAEKNWGRSFPSRWFWMQCNTFWTEPDLCVVALGAIRKVLSFEETVGMIAIHYKGRFYEFANWTCTSLQWAVRWGCWSVASVSRDGFRAQLTGTTSENGVQILGPTDHGMRFTMRDTMHGHLRVSLIDPSGNTVVETNSTNAQLEIGGEPWGKEWMASVPGLKQPLRGIINYFNR